MDIKSLRFSKKTADFGVDNLAILTGYDQMCCASRHQQALLAERIGGNLSLRLSGISRSLA